MAPAAVMANVVSTTIRRPDRRRDGRLTGRRVVRLIHDLTKGAQLAEADERASYIDRFLPPRNRTESGHDVMVKTTRAGVKLLTDRAM